MTDGPPATDVAAYARIYEDQQPQLVAYARSLTGDPWLAEDVVAEAHFRVWRRLSAGHEIDNVAAYLTRTVRNVASTVGSSAAREIPVATDATSPGGPEPVSVAFPGSSADPSARISHVDLLSRVLGQLPERWVKALWLAEAEDQPLDAVGRRIGIGSGATAVLLHRAREGMRQAFLRAHPGAPQDDACAIHWERMPALVRDAASPRHSEQLRRHMDGCEDCRARFLLLARANSRLGALTGPALLVLVLGGGAKFLVPAAGAAGTVGGQGGQGGWLHAAHQAVTGGLKLPAVALGAVGASVTGAAIAAGLMVGAAEPPVPAQRVATQQSDSAPGPSTPAATGAPLAGQESEPQDSPAAPLQESPAPPAQDAPAQAPAEAAPSTAADRAVADEPTEESAQRTEPQEPERQEPAPEAPTDQAPPQPPSAQPTDPAPAPATPSQPVEPPATPPSEDPAPATPPPSDPAPPVDPTPVDPDPPVDPTPSDPVEPPDTGPAEPPSAEPTPVDPVDPAPVCHDILRGGITITVCYSAGG
ncbi:sigma factor [Streptomyces sp. NBC_01304]|uniref:sigma factor n=1 Tax=Streptomyces sp. NBC_01304 TaxID=2903818 RepID=UPI002E12C837|nr:zf-HC2 domain-containing protein [Streptomyces sp. NBC_01304]